MAASKKKPKKSAKKKTPTTTERTPQSVAGTPREHRMIDAEKLREDVKGKANGYGG